MSTLGSRFHAGQGLESDAREVYVFDTDTGTTDRFNLILVGVLGELMLARCITPGSPEVSKSVTA